MRAGEVEIGTDERRAPQRREDGALLRWLTRERRRHCCAQPGSFDVVLDKAPGERADEVAIVRPTENLEPRETTFAEA